MGVKKYIIFFSGCCFSFVVGFLTNMLYEDFSQNELSLDEDNNSGMTSRSEEIDFIQVENYAMENGFVYTGSLRNKERYGRGQMKTPKGTYYDGDWEGNKLKKGKMITDDFAYKGEFKGLSPSGFGNMQYKDGSYYEGAWIDGLKNGIGLFVDSLGNKRFGEWKNGILDKKTMNTNPHGKVYGIDLSHHNCIRDWNNIAIYVKKDGTVCESKPKKDFVYHPISFVFLKATEGETHRDRLYLDNLYKLKEKGMLVGSYHYMKLLSSTVESQADNFLDFAIYREGDLPPVLDIEDYKDARTIGKTKTKELVLKWLQLVEDELNVRPIIYTNTKMKRDFLDSKEFDKYHFWIAHYTKTQPDCRDYFIWQFTDRGQLYANNGLVDVNYYNGTTQELKKHIEMFSSRKEMRNELN